ncbi:MAG: hypothetical protein WC461_02970 [Candidatus Paceibacterota bacterium]
MKKIFARFIGRHPQAAGALSIACLVICVVFWALSLANVVTSSVVNLAFFTAGIIFFYVSVALVTTKPKRDEDKKKIIGGPYYLGQAPAPCGCYHPDVVFNEDQTTGERTVICKNHGTCILPVPTDEWRERMRQSFKKTSPA